MSYHGRNKQVSKVEGGGAERGTFLVRFTLDSGKRSGLGGCPSVASCRSAYVQECVDGML